MKQEIRHPEKRAHTGSYSAGVLMDGWLFISGQGPLDMATGKVIGDNIETQTRITMEHIGKILAEAGADFDDVVKCTCHLARISDFEAFDRVYSGFFPGICPARTTVESGLSGILVEIDAIARVPR
jgi:2-iminobutanoate/2-iminopropanoate deaminase